MERINVALGERSYPIMIGRGLLRHDELFEEFVRGRALVITDERVAPLYLDTMIATLEIDPADVLVLEGGEGSKNLATFSRIMDFLLERRVDRDGTLIALGGGVIGDLVGFAAACYRRGIGFIQVPTTLLAQVDSSVGGKTGVNHPLGKNMIGAFHQPRCVVIDTDTLVTLPDREVSAGLAEVIKYAVIQDSRFFDWLDQYIDRLRSRDQESVSHAIKTSCECKVKIVAMDETESGIRAILNFGHTFGHAFENTLRYGEILHGEAVGLGMRCASRMCVSLGLLSGDEVLRIESLIDRAGLPDRLPRLISLDEAFGAMRSDKKVLGGALRLVVAQGIGSAGIRSDVPDCLIRQAIQSVLPE